MERVSTSEAAAILGMSRHEVCKLMDEGHLPIGYVIPSRSGKTKKHLIYRGLLEQYVGRNNDEKEN